MQEAPSLVGKMKQKWGTTPRQLGGELGVIVGFGFERKLDSQGVEQAVAAILFETTD